MRTGEVAERQLSTQQSEFPRVHPQRLGRAFRYVYTALFKERDRLSPLAIGVLKHDLHSGTETVHAWGEHRYGGECVFVPRRGARNEDDGYLMTFVFDEPSGRSEFVVLDARDMTAAPLCRVPLPVRVPYGFHGRWVTDAEIAAQRFD